MMNLALPMDLLNATGGHHHHHHHHHQLTSGVNNNNINNTNGIGHPTSLSSQPVTSSASSSSSSVNSQSGLHHSHSSHHSQHHSNHHSQHHHHNHHSQHQHHHHIPTRLYNSPPPISSSDPTVNDCKLIEYRGKQLVSFTVGGEKMLCLPQAVDMFLKNYVGGPHTVYCKLKRLDIVPLVCNTEQIRILRGLGVLQPGVNRCKLLSVKDFDTLLDDCENARPGRPPKRGTIGMPLPPSAAAAYLASATSAAAAAEHPQIKKLRQENGDDNLYDDRNHLTDSTLQSHHHNHHLLDGSNKSSPSSSAASNASQHLLAETANQINHMAFMQMNNFPSLMANRMSTAAAAAAAAAAAGMFPTSAMTAEQEHLLRRAATTTSLSSSSSTPTTTSHLNQLNNQHHSHHLSQNDSILKDQIINREIDMETFFRSGLWAKNITGVGNSNNYQSQYEDMVKNLERFKEDNDAIRRNSTENKYNKGSGNGINHRESLTSSPVLNLSKSDNTTDINSAPAAASSVDGAEDSWSRKSRSITPDNDGKSEKSIVNNNEDDNGDGDEEMRDNDEKEKEKIDNDHQMIQDHSRPSSTLMSRTPSRNVSPLIEEPTFSMEILLRNIQALLKIAADNAMQYEKQNIYERAELKMDVMREKEIKDSIEKQLNEERKLRVLYQKRYRKEKRLRARLG